MERSGCKLPRREVFGPGRGDWSPVVARIVGEYDPVVN